MSDLGAAIIPPAPPVPPRDLPLIPFLVRFLRSSISTFPDHAFEVMVARRRVLGIDTILLNDPAAARHVLMAARDRYRRRVAPIRMLRPLAGAGLLLSEGEVWRRQRRSLAPVFTPSAVGEMIPHFQAASESLLRRLEGSPRANLSQAFQDAALEAVLRGLFSAEPKGDVSGLEALVHAYLDGPGRPSLLDGLARHEDDFAFAGGPRRRFQAQWFAAVDGVIAERRSTTASDKRDMLSLLVEVRDPETGEPLADSEIRDQAATMLAAGYETTARLMFWTTYLLALDQAEQDRVRAEIRAHPPEQASSLDDMAQWPSLRRSLLEALRLYPPAAHIVRDAVEDDEIMGEPVTAGTQVWISPWVIHRHRRFWENPTAFMPARFKDQRSPWTSGPFLPFGLGPRICIGSAFAMTEAEMIIATLLNRYRISLADPRPLMPVTKITTRPSIEPVFKLERV